MPKEMPRVFISYSHDSPKHSAWVQKLATDLHDHGVGVFLDVWDLKPGESVRLIESEAAAADQCLVVCTPRYREVAEKRRSDGVSYVTTLIRDALSEQSAKHPRIMPIVRAGEGKAALPDWLVGHQYLDLREDDAYTKHFGQLLRGIQSRVKEHGAAAPKKKEKTSKDEMLTIDLNLKDFNQAKLADLSKVLKFYLGDEVKVTEK